MPSPDSNADKAGELMPEADESVLRSAATE